MATGALIASLAATAVSTISSYQNAKTQADNQKAQAKFQANIARQNQELAEDQASAQRREGYEAMVRKRQEVAGIISRQRAVAGASGAQVDQGSFLDLNMETAEKGELDALALYQQGLDNAYNSEIQAWNYGTQAQGYTMQAKQADTISPSLAAATTAIGGLAQTGAGFGANGWDNLKAEWGTNKKNGVSSKK